MRQVLNRYNKDALLANVNNARVTYQIIRDQIKKDGFTIIQNTSWTTWYLIPTSVTGSGVPTQGIFNVYSELGQFNTEEELLTKYLVEKM